MEVILDTNALSAFMTADKEIREFLESAPAVYVPSVVLGEYRFGLLNSRDRIDLELKLTILLAQVYVLSIDAETTHHYAEIRHQLKRIGKPIPVNDLWIAAIARQHNLPLVTRDKHFSAVDGIIACDW